MIIPAKGHSTRLPGKNIKLFCGHPLVAWSIVQGRYAKLVDEVWVSTDSDEVREIAEGYGANVMMRDYEDKEDTPGYVPIANFINRMIWDGNLTREDKVIARLCTTPTLLPHDTDAAIELAQWMFEKYAIHGITMGAELRTVSMFRKVVDGIGRSLPLDCRCENNGDIVQSLAFFGVQTASTLVDDPPHPNGPEIRRGGEHPLVCYYNVKPWQMQDVDTPEEWEFAELVAEHYILKGRDMLEVYKND